MAGFAVDLLRVFQNRIDRNPAAVFQAAVETALASGMAGDAAGLLGLMIPL